MAILDKITTEVTEATTVMKSAAALITSLAQQIRDNVGNAEALNALADDLDANSNALGQAVADNTVAEEETAPEE